MKTFYHKIYGVYKKKYTTYVTVYTLQTLLIVIYSFSNEISLVIHFVKTSVNILQNIVSQIIAKDKIKVTTNINRKSACNIKTRNKKMENFI